jgi:hypothetical protein
MKITATTHNEFIVETGDLTADLRPITVRCVLGGNILRTAPCRHGEISVLPSIRVHLGAVSFAKVTALKTGESVDVKPERTNDNV